MKKTTGLNFLEAAAISKETGAAIRLKDALGPAGKWSRLIVDKGNEVMEYVDDKPAEDNGPFQWFPSLDEMREEEWEVREEEKPPHWPGRYSGDRSFVVNANYGNVRLKDDSPNIRQYRRSGICCRTVAEVDFVRAHQSAYLELIDKIQECNSRWKQRNDDWRPDWNNPNEDKVYFTLQRVPEVKVVIEGTELYGNVLHQTLKDELYMRSGLIAERILEELGEGKVKLALWPHYEEKEDE